MQKINISLTFVIVLFTIHSSLSYDPSDDELKTILPSSGMFEAFYPNKVFGVKSGPSRASHGHGSFYQHRNPALVDVKNPAAYGYRFDGYRRFNFD